MEEIINFINRIYTFSQRSPKKKQQYKVYKYIWLFFRIFFVYVLIGYVIFSVFIWNMNIIEWPIADKVLLVFTTTLLSALYTYSRYLTSSHIKISKKELNKYLHLIYNTALLAERLKNLPMDDVLINPFTDSKMVHITADDIIDFTIEHMD